MIKSSSVNLNSENGFIQKEINQQAREIYDSIKKIQLIKAPERLLEIQKFAAMRKEFLNSHILPVKQASSGEQPSASEPSASEKRLLPEKSEKLQEVDMHGISVGAVMDSFIDVMKDDVERNRKKYNSNEIDEINDLDSAGLSNTHGKISIMLQGIKAFKEQRDDNKYNEINIVFNTIRDHEINGEPLVMHHDGVSIKETIEDMMRNENNKFSCIELIELERVLDLVNQKEVTSHNLRANQTSSLPKSSDGAGKAEGDVFLPGKNEKLQKEKKENELTSRDDLFEMVEASLQSLSHVEDDGKRLEIINDLGIMTANIDFTNAGIFNKNDISTVALLIQSGIDQHYFRNNYEVDYVHELLQELNTHIQTQKQIEADKQREADAEYERKKDLRPSYLN